LVKISRRDVLFKKVFCRRFVIIVFAFKYPKKTSDSLEVTEIMRLKGCELYEKKRYLT